MKIVDLFNQPNIVDLSFFNFRNAITAAYFANREFGILRINESSPYLNAIQGQFIDRTEEWNLRREREEPLEQKIRDREVVEELRRIQEEFEQPFEGE